MRVFVHLQEEQQKECLKVLIMNQKQFIVYFNTIQEQEDLFMVKKSTECDVLIIDESSMIDVLLAEQLMNAVPLHSAVVCR